MIKGIAAGNPFNRLGEAEEIAKAIGFFASDESTWVSGQILRVNGAFVV